MPANSKTIIAPINGLEIGAPGSLIDPRATPDCLNVEIYKSLIRKRRGGEVFSTSMGERILAIGEFFEDDVYNLFRIGPTKAQVWKNDAWTEFANSPLSGGEETLVDFAFPILSGKKVLVYTNGEDNIRVFTGTVPDSDLGGTPPVAKFMLNFSGYLLLGNYVDGLGNQHRQGVAWSDAGDPEQWDGSVEGSNAGAVDLLEDDLDITGLAYFGGYAAVHKVNSIYLGYLTGGDDVFRFDRKETVAGTIAHRSIVNLPTGEQMFLSLQGLRLFNGITAPLIDSSINIELSEIMTPSYVNRSWGIAIKELNEAWFGIPVGGGNQPDTVYKYNWLTRQIYKDTFPNASMVGLFTKTTDDSWDNDNNSWDSDNTSWDATTAQSLSPRLMIGYSSGETVERTDSANDAGAAVSSRWASKDFTAMDFGVDDPEGSFLEWQGVEVIASGTEITVEYSINEGETWTPAGSLTLSSSYPSDDSPKIVYFRVLATKCRFRFSNDSVDGSFNLKQFRPIAAQREPRRV